MITINYSKPGSQQNVRKSVTVYDFSNIYTKNRTQHVFIGCSLSDSCPHTTHVLFLIFHECTFILSALVTCDARQIDNCRTDLFLFNIGSHAKAINDHA